MPEEATEGEKLASDVVAISALPARWIGASLERVAQDVAATLHHLCGGEVRRVEVRVEVPSSNSILAVQPLAGELPAEGQAILVEPSSEFRVPIGRYGCHGEIRAVGTQGASLTRLRLLATIASNQLDAACRAVDLERDVARAHAEVAVLSKLSTLGQLVGGVAHELRTPITFATNNIYLLRRDLARLQPDAAEATEPKLQELELALDRINAIVKQLHRFARHVVEPEVEEDLRDCVRDALRLWRATNVDCAPVRDQLGPTSPVRVDRGQMQQVVLNLLQNATDATGPRGNVVLRTWSDETHALLSVEDDGPGMTPAMQANLFQPFRTTKPHGLGLGLSIVRDIVEAHHGSIDIDSRPGEGTRVRVRIPRASFHPGQARLAANARTNGVI